MKIFYQVVLHKKSLKNHTIRYINNYILKIYSDKIMNKLLPKLPKLQVLHRHLHF